LLGCFELRPTAQRVEAYPAYMGNFLVLVVHRVVPAKLATRKSEASSLLENARTGSPRARMTRPALVSKCTLNGAGSGSGCVVD
jgi:hypothetical protein